MRFILDVDETEIPGLEKLTKKQLKLLKEEVERTLHYFLDDQNIIEEVRDEFFDDAVDGEE